MNAKEHKRLRKEEHLKEKEAQIQDRLAAQKLEAIQACLEKESRELKAEVNCFPMSGFMVGWRWAKLGSQLFWKTWMASLPIYALIGFFIMTIGSDRPGGDTESLLFSMLSSCAYFGALILLWSPLAAILTEASFDQSLNLMDATKKIEPWSLLKGTGIGVGMVVLICLAAQVLLKTVSYFAGGEAWITLVGLFSSSVLLLYGFAGLPFLLYLVILKNEAPLSSLQVALKMGFKSLLAWLGVCTRFVISGFFWGLLLGALYALRRVTGSDSGNPVDQAHAQMIVTLIAFLVSGPQVIASSVVAAVSLLHKHAKEEYGGSPDSPSAEELALRLARQEVQEVGDKNEIGRGSVGDDPETRILSNETVEIGVTRAEVPPERGENDAFSPTLVEADQTCGPKESEAILSPCMGCCRVDSIGGGEGCSRTTTEIELWSSLSNEEKKAIVSRGQLKDAETPREDP